MQHNNLEERGVVEVASFASALTSPPEAKCQKDENFASKEPMSVLDTRSPSPSTSSSTLSSSFDGINGDKLANLLVVGSDKDDPKRNVTLSCTSETAAYDGGSYNPEEEFAAELKSVPAGLELNRRGVERLNFGLEEWEGFLSESEVQDQSILRWVSGDSDDSALGLKQLLQGGNSSSSYQVEGSANYVSGYEGLASGGGSGGADGGLTGQNSSSGSLVHESSLCSNGGKICSVPNSLGSGSHQKHNFSASPNNSNHLPPQDSSVAHKPQFQCDLKSEIPHPKGLVNQFQLQNPRNLSPSNPEQPQAKRHNPGIPDMDSGSQVPPRSTFLNQGNELLLKKAQNLTQLQQIQVALGSKLNLLSHNPQLKPKQEVVEGSAGGLMTAPSLNQHQQQEVVYEQLYKAIELILAGNSPHAQVILSRLNHQLSPFFPVVKPFYRSAFYLMEALQFVLVMMPNSNLMRIPSPFDAMIKMGAYKTVCEVSPLIRFKNFTSNQALFEAIGNEENIHIIDFDIGMGDEWSSFMQDLPRRNKGCTSLKITAFASPSTHHPFEISLIHESLNDIATNVGINFQLEVVNFDTFEPSAYAASSFRSSLNEVIAVSFPIWSCSSRPSIIPSLLCFIKQLSPKAVVLFDRGCERYDLPPSHHLLHALQYYELLLESIDAAANMAQDSISKIEKLLLQPKIENIVCGRLHSPNIMPPFTNLLASAGFSPVPISSFCEAQAGWVVKRAQSDGFHVEKRQAHTSLVLCWQRRELLSASVWKC